MAFRHQMQKVREWQDECRNWRQPGDEPFLKAAEKKVQEHRREAHQIALDSGLLKGRVR